MNGEQVILNLPVIIIECGKSIQRDDKNKKYYIYSSDFVGFF